MNSKFYIHQAIQEEELHFIVKRKVWYFLEIHYLKVLGEEQICQQVE